MFHVFLSGSSSRAQVQWQSNCSHIPGVSASGADATTSDHACAASVVPVARLADGVGVMRSVTPYSESPQVVDAMNGGRAAGGAGGSTRGAGGTAVGVAGVVGAGVGALGTGVEGEGDDDDTVVVVDPTAVSSDSVLLSAQPAAAIVTSTIAVAAQIGLWRRSIGGSLPRSRGCKRARMLGSCD